MIRIGILGNIGSGKSYVAKSFRYPVFNADLEVSKIYKNNKNSILLCNMGKGCLIITDRSQIEFDSVKKISNKELMNVIQKKYLIGQTS